MGLQSGRQISVSMDFTFNLNAEWLEHGPSYGEAMGNELLCVLPLRGSNAPGCEDIQHRKREDFL